MKKVLTLVRLTFNILFLAQTLNLLLISLKRFAGKRGITHKRTNNSF